MNSSEPAYFPNSPIQGHYELDEFTADSNAQFLRHMSEPALFGLQQTNPGQEAYRILCMPAFDSPWLFRVTRSDDRFWAVYKTIEGKPRWRQLHGSFERPAVSTHVEAGAPMRSVNVFWKPPRESSSVLTQEHWDTCERLLEKHFFWSTPLFGLSGGKDGEDWLMEGSRASQYRVITRWDGGLIQAFFSGLCKVLPADLVV